MALFYALLMPCFSQKMTEEACRYLKNKISEETEMESLARRLSMTEEEAYNALESNINKYPNTQKQFVEIKKLKSLCFNDEIFFVIEIDKINGAFDFITARIKNGKELCYSYTFRCSNIFDQDNLFPYENTILASQIDNFRYKKTSVFFYDFNHDGNEELLGFRTSGQGNVFGIITFDYINNKSRYIFKIIVMLPYKIPAFEFILFKGRQGIKVYEHDYSTDNNEWCFYYYDRIQQKYVQDENASSEELEQIHGSPDFFAEAGIDYAKLERPLLPADLEGFSKAALRIWRNAVYARHGRTFRSEDLQALFNEYAWYKPDNEYTDDKLTDIDKANIKLIQEFEKK